MEKMIIGALAGGLAIYGLYYLLTHKKVKKFDTLKFSDVMELSKDLIKDTGISQNQNLVLLKVDGKGHMITFYDKVKSEIIQETTIILECNNIDESLRLAYGDKDMIVIEE